MHILLLILLVPLAFLLAFYWVEDIRDGSRWSYWCGVIFIAGALLDLVRPWLF